MRALRFLTILVVALGVVFSGCDSQPSRSPKQVAQRLLVLHDLLGKLPEQRSRRAKEEEVDRDDLKEIFSDLDSHDKFIADVYVGVVVGALAAHQSKLGEKIDGRRAIITAGKAEIVMEIADGEWKINLDRTIPQEMKTRAVEEKARYEAAREAGKALGSASR